MPTARHYEEQESGWRNDATGARRRRPTDERPNAVEKRNETTVDAQGIGHDARHYSTSRQSPKSISVVLTTSVVGACALEIRMCVLEILCDRNSCFRNLSYTFQRRTDTSSKREIKTRIDVSTKFPTDQQT